jgi:hypothetical protein
MPAYTPTQVRMLRLFSDGMPHTKEDLHGCLPDELSAVEAIRFHICLLREKLRPIGQDIVCELDHGKTYYRHVRMLRPVGES